VSNAGIAIIRVHAMSDVLFLLLGLGGIAALFGYAAFCNRH
jgi:hypothetical protein